MTMHTFRMAKFGAITLVLIGSATMAFGQAPTPAPAPTDQELQSMFDKKEYRTCLQQTARVMQLRGDAANAYDKYTLQMRRGECFLNLGDWASAGYAYNAAKNAAHTAGEAEQARAMELLVQASRGGSYYPAKAQNNPINITSSATRRDALTALFNDQFAAAQGQIKAAQNSTSLVPLIRFVPKAQDLHALEMGATGSDAQTAPVLISLGDLARRMISTELQNKNSIITGIQNRANTMASSGFNWVTGANGTELLVADTRVGLSPNDRQTLREMIPYLGEIVEATHRGKRVAQSLGRDGVVWDPVIAQAQSVAQRAQNVLDAD